MAKNLKFGQKSKIRPKIKIFVNINSGQTKTKKNTKSPKNHILNSNIDAELFGPKHIYNYPTPIETRVYYPTEKSVPYDPEGILGTLTSIFMVYLGLQAGKWFNFYDSNSTRLKYLFSASAIVRGKSF